MRGADGESATCFIDSNIWLYAFIETQDARKSELAQSIIQESTIEVSTQVINEISVNLIKKADFSEKQVRELIQSFYRKYHIIEANQDVLLSASSIREQYHFSFWDSLIMASALHVEATVLFSEDMQDGFVIGKTKIKNPFK